VIFLSSSPKIRLSLLQVLLVQPAHREIPARQVLKDHKECRVLPVRQVRWDPPDLKAHKGQLETLAPLVYKDQKVIRAILELKAPRAHKDQKVIRAILELKAPRARPVPPDRLKVGTADHQIRQVVRE